MTTRAKWTILVVLVAAGIVAYSLRFHFYERLYFEGPQEIQDHYRSNMSTLGRGIWYVGDKNNESLFLRKLEIKGNEVWVIPAGSWSPPRRFELSSSEDKWISWEYCWNDRRYY